MNPALPTPWFLTQLTDPGAFDKPVLVSDDADSPRPVAERLRLRPLLLQETLDPDMEAWLTVRALKRQRGEIMALLLSTTHIYIYGYIFMCWAALRISLKHT